MGKAVGLYVILPLMVLASVKSQAEYRAFELKISKKENPEQFRLVLSTLDPFQYAGYNIVREDEVVQYTRTWMCPGRTYERPICPDPKAVIASEVSETPAEITTPVEPDSNRTPASN